MKEQHRTKAILKHSVKHSDVQIGDIVWIDGYILMPSPVHQDGITAIVIYKNKITALPIWALEVDVYLMPDGSTKPC